MGKPRFFFSTGEGTVPIAGELRIGSGEDCDLVVADKGVEPLTALARVEGGERVVLETRAKEAEAKVNGTLLSLAELESGTGIRIGGIELTLEGSGVDVALAGEAGRFPLKVGANFVGRMPEASVMLDDPSVSRKHALVLVLPGGKVRLRDLGSSNGTFVGERQLGRMELKHGDRVQVGDTTLTFLSGPAMAAASGRGAAAEAASGSEGAAAPPSTGAGAAEPAPKAARPPLDATVIAGSPQAPAAAGGGGTPEPEGPRFELRVDGETRRLAPGQEVIVGRAPECDLAFTDDEQASRRHARIAVRDGEMRVEDLGSSNGTRLNGRPLDRSAGPLTLSDGDRIGVGRHELEVRVERPVDPHGATVLAPGGLGGPVPPASPGAPPSPPGRGPAPSAGAPRPLPTDRATALAVLDLPPGSGEDEARRRYQELVSDYRIRLTNAPTPELQERYSRRLEELRRAAAILLPAAAEDLPVSRPVDAPLPGRGAAGGAGAGAGQAGSGGAVPGSTAAPPPSAPPAPGGAAAPPAPVRGAGEASAAPPSPPAAEPASGGGGIPRATWIMAAVTLVLLLVSAAFVVLYLKAAAVESGLRGELEAKQDELAAMTERIPEAGVEFQVLREGLAAKLENHELKICNQGSRDLVVDWLHASYVSADGSFEGFNSAKFGYPTWRIPPGGTQKFDYVSGDQVLFDGSAVFFSVTFRYGAEEYFRSGAVAQLSADCYAIDLDR